MRFGMFMAPFHAQVDQNPTLALERDAETVEYLETLGFEEAWFGEHHSAGVETIASPEIFCAYMASRTTRIRLGTGVISLPYHNPLWVADRAVLLSHLTRGRFMLGLGPGVLEPDATMIGLDPRRLREHLVEDLPVLLHLLRSHDPITVSTDRYDLVDARLQLDTYGELEVAITSGFTPNGPTLAGRHGLGLLQLAAMNAMHILPEHLETMETAAHQAGRTVDSAGVRVVGIMHLAPTRYEAMEDVRFGLDAYFNYNQDVLGVSDEAGRTFAERLEWVMTSGYAVVGSVEDAISRLGDLVEVAGDRVGAFLLWGHEWASYEATRRSLELIARRVMPVFQGSTRRLKAAYDWAGVERVARQARWDAEVAEELAPD